MLLYIKIDNKPFFVIYDSISVPVEFMEVFEDLAKKNGFAGIFFVASNRSSNEWNYAGKNFNAKISGDYNMLLNKKLNDSRVIKLLKVFKKLIYGKNNIKKLDYSIFFKSLKYTSANVATYPMVVPNWDNSPRSKEKGFLFTNSSPDKFALEIKKAINFVNTSTTNEKFIIIKSWNEWAEGNFIEPCQKWNRKFLEIIKKSLQISNK